MTTTKSWDKYDAAIAYLQEHPEELLRAWCSPREHVAGCLFQFATPTGNRTKKDTGCLTMIKNNSAVWHAHTSEITAAIVADPRVPNKPTMQSLPVLAEWQRFLDVVWERRHPNAA